MKYLIVDSANMFFRARHVVRGEDIHTRIGMSLHILFNSIHKVWMKFKPDHMVLCFEGRSWRKDIFELYKRNRVALREKLSEKERKEEEAYWEAFQDFNKFMADKTNCTVLQHEEMEADDFIARWTQLHPDDEHIVISSDSDFYQLLADNVSMYNGISNTLINTKGFYNDVGKEIIDKKTKEPKEAPDPEWLLFEKCMRGDTSDNIFSAYPGVRTKGTRNKVGLTEAFEDRHKKGYSWNNLMLQRWEDHEGNEHRVKDRYEQNKALIDLTAQPDWVKEKLDQAISTQVQQAKRPQIGIHLMKFCGKFGLTRIGESATQHVDYLTKSYAS